MLVSSKKDTTVDIIKNTCLMLKNTLLFHFCSGQQPNAGQNLQHISNVPVVSAVCHKDQQLSNLRVSFGIKIIQCTFLNVTNVRCNT